MLTVLKVIGIIILVIVVLYLLMIMPRMITVRILHLFKGACMPTVVYMTMRPTHRKIP